MTNTPETLNILNPDFRMPEHCGGDRWSILHGDSLQIIRQFEPNSFDAIITDPPYASGGSSQTTKNRSTSEKYSSMSKDKALPDFDSDQMDQLSWMFWTAAWLQDARRIARHIRTGEEGYTAIVGQVYENNGRKASGYNIGKVFDITQTRGRPVPPPANYQVDELIAAAIESSPVPIQISDSLPDGIQAQYVPKNRTIYVRNGMDAGTTLCAIVRECAQADFHKDYTYNRQAYAAPSYCAAYMVAHRYGLDTTAFNFDRVVALYRNLGTEQQRGFLSDVNTVGGGLLRSLSRTLAVQTREPPAAEYAVAVPSAKKQSRQQERG